MLLWFAGGALVAAWAVFRDPAVDYRLVMLGAVVPDLVDLPWGGARVAHSVTFSVALLALVMVVTRSRRALRRHLLALPIGTFLHLALDGAFTETKVFWWPFSGGFDGARFPSVARGAWNIPLEIVGVAALAWGWRRFGLADPTRRRAFVATGRLRPVP